MRFKLKIHTADKQQNCEMCNAARKATKLKPKINIINKRNGLALHRVGAVETTVRKSPRNI